MSQWKEAMQSRMPSFLRPRSLRWFSTRTSPGPSIRAAAHVSSASNWGSSQGSSSQGRGSSSQSSSQGSSSQGSSSEGSRCRGSSSCRSHRHHRRQNYTSLASGDPRCRPSGLGWGIGQRPAHEFVVREAPARRQVLHRISKREASPAGPLRPAIWADTTDDQRSGLRALEARWEARAAAASTASQVLGKEASRAA